MNCPKCNWTMVMFTGHWYCRKCGHKMPFVKTDAAGNTQGLENK